MPKGQYKHNYIPGRAAWNRLYTANHYKAKSGGSLSLECFKLIVEQPCAYCGDPPPKVNPYGTFWPNSNKWLTHHYWQDCWIEANGIDKIVPCEDYSDPSNLCSCCYSCNWMKGVMGRDAFLAHIKKINDYQESKKK